MYKKEKPNQVFQNPINVVKSNLNILKNSFKDLKEIINKYEFILEQLNHNSKENSKEILLDFEKFKEKVEIDSIFIDAKQTFIESIYSLEEIEKHINSAELVSNVELN